MSKVLETIAGWLESAAKWVRSLRGGGQGEEQ